MIKELIIAAMIVTAVADSGYYGADPQLLPREPAEERVIEPEEVLAVVSEPQEMHLYGRCRITFYCHCAACNGRAGANCASGVQPTTNHTVANGSLPFGTRLMIDGQEYVVEDRGVGAMEIDIFVASHEEALQRGLYYTDVYIIDG